MILLQGNVCIAHRINIMILIQNLVSFVLEELAILSNKNNVYRHQRDLDQMEQTAVTDNAHQESSMMSCLGIALTIITLEYVRMINLIMMLRLINVWSVQLVQG